MTLRRLSTPTLGLIYDPYFLHIKSNLYGASLGKRDMNFNKNSGDVDIAPALGKIIT